MSSNLSELEMKRIAKLFASKFIARSDVKAIQRSSGEYNPVESPFSMKDLLDHISSELTYGHYLLSQDSQCKLFVFDIDLDKPEKDRNGDIIRDCFIPTECDTDGNWINFVPGNPREVWLDRTKILQRNFFKFQLRMLANMLARGIHDNLGIQVAAAYTGSKGVHVYGFTGLMQADQVRQGAELVLDSLGCFEQLKGNNFFKHKNAASSTNDELDYRDITIEVFPKQTTLNGKTHGNLCRLPLGRNLKNPKDPTFFLDFRGNFGEKSFMQRDAVDALTASDYWAWT